jgi:hypothetical protein
LGGIFSDCCSTEFRSLRPHAVATIIFRLRRHEKILAPRKDKSGLRIRTTLGNVTPCARLEDVPLMDTLACCEMI